MIRLEQHSGAGEKLVLVKAKGGMGNRMLCAVTGIAYGLLTERQVIVDWTDAAYSTDGENAFNRYFRSTNVDSDAPLPDCGTVVPPVWAGHLDWSVSRMVHTYDPTKHKSFRIQRKYSIDPGELEFTEDIVVVWAYTHQIPALRRHVHRLPGELWPTNTDGILGRLLNEYLILVPEIQEQIDAFKAANFKTPMVGVHVRHSDRSADVERYVAVTERLLEQMPGAGLFVATDNSSVLERFNSEFGTVVATEKWYPEAGATMHQNDACPDPYQNGVEALLDMELLARCDGLIYPGGSTFSRIAALRIDAPPERVIDMERFNLRVRGARFARSLLS